MTILEAIREVLSADTPTHLQELYQALPDTLEHSIRARIYENLGKHFRRISQGVYVAIEGDAACVVVSGDALEEIRKMPSGSFDALITDPAYPWLNAHLKKGTSRKTKGAWSFKTEEINTDLALEMWRVLKKGAHAFFFEILFRSPHKLCCDNPAFQVFRFLNVGFVRHSQHPLCRLAGGLAV